MACRSMLFSHCCLLCVSASARRQSSLKENCQLAVLCCFRKTYVLFDGLRENCSQSAAHVSPGGRHTPHRRKILTSHILCSSCVPSSTPTCDVRVARAPRMRQGVAKVAVVVAVRAGQLSRVTCDSLSLSLTQSRHAADRS